LSISPEKCSFLPQSEDYLKKVGRNDVFGISRLYLYMITVVLRDQLTYGNLTGRDIEIYQ
jgi:hypothetical protein